MEDSKSLLEQIAEQDRKNKAEAAEIMRKRLGVYQGLAVEVIRQIYVSRDSLAESAKAVRLVNKRIEELEKLYPGYLSFLSKFDAGNTEFEPGEVRYLIDYLLTSKWTKDADFWRVLSQICDTIDVPNNPFKEINDG